MVKVFTGTTQECLEHFSQGNRFNTPEREACKLRNAVSEFFGINHQTGYGWFSQFRLPTGENLLRLRFFLSLLGYEVVERNVVPKILREFSDMVCLRTLSFEEAAYLIGGTAVPAVLLDVSFGRYGVSGEREEKITELVELYKKEATVKLEEWKTKIESFGLANFSAIKIVPAQTPESSKEDSKPVLARLNGEVVKTLAHLILAIKPWAELLLSEEFSPEQRQQLRELTATNGRSNAVFEVSNALNRLCSERARKEIQ